METHTYLPGTSTARGEYRAVTTDYFAAFSIHVASLGDFSMNHDQQKSEQVVLVNQAFVKQFLSGRESAFARDLRDDGTAITIVGRCRRRKTIRTNSKHPGCPEPSIFPIAQSVEGQKRSMSLVISSRGAIPASLIAAARGQLRES